MKNAVADKDLSFDYAGLVEKVARITRSKAEDLHLPFGFLPKHFTLGELQLNCGQLLNRPLHKSSFRRRLAERDLLEPNEGAMNTRAFGHTASPLEALLSPSGQYHNRSSPLPCGHTLESHHDQPVSLLDSVDGIER